MNFRKADINYNLPCDSECNNFVTDQVCLCHEKFENIPDFLLQKK